MSKFVEVGTIKPGECFRRLTGRTPHGGIYVRINPASLQFWGLNEEDVFAVRSKDGHMASLNAHTDVYPVPISELSTPFREAYLEAKGA